MPDVKYRQWVRFAIPWMLLCSGLALLEWLHTFRDQLAHNIILPLLLALWSIALLLLWDGCTMVRQALRLAIFVLQAVGSMFLVFGFLSHLIR
jgi:hypothetical protein